MIQKESSVKIEEIIIQSLNELAEDYKTNERRYLTEGDSVANLFSIINQKFKVTDVPLLVHLEMRPYTTHDGKTLIIGSERKGSKVKWIKQEKANDGYLVDLAVIDLSESFWSEAIEKAKFDQSAGKLKYWRILSYPVRAFLVAIEVKVRVQGNTTRIRQDIDKLEAVKIKNPSCLTYFVILDRCASSLTLKEIFAYANRKNVTSILFGDGEADMFEQVKIRVKERMLKDGKEFEPGEVYDAEVWGNYLRVEMEWNSPSGILIPRDKADILEDPGFPVCWRYWKYYATAKGESDED